MNDASMESALIGCALQGAHHTLAVCENYGITKDSFSDPAIGVIFAAVRAMDTEGAPIDLTTVTNRLMRDGTLEKIGGSERLETAVDAVGTIQEASYYAREIKAAERDRETRSTGMLIAEGKLSCEDAVNRLNELDQSTHLSMGRSLVQYFQTPPDPEDTLLGNRFLCREGGQLFIGPSGIGKSSASVQMDVSWAIGMAAFGITPARPIRILCTQAENDAGDLHEMARGVIRGLELTDDQIAMVGENTLYIPHKSTTGPDFIRYLRREIRAFKPDIVRIDPLQAYLGGDPKDSGLISRFCREGLNPLLEEFQCGCILNHHTPKTNFRHTEDWKASDWMYAGAGAADLTNWSRAVMVIDPCEGNPSVFRFIAAKRGRRIGWVDEDGIPTFEQFFAHTAYHGEIFWEIADPEQANMSGANGKPTKADLLALITENEPAMDKDVLISRAGAVKIGANKARGFIKEAIHDGDLYESKAKRSGKRDRVLVSKNPPPKQGEMSLVTARE